MQESAWPCLFHVFLGQRDAGIILADGATCASGYQLHLAQPFQVDSWIFLAFFVQQKQG